jgi:hypothetical protein
MKSFWERVPMNNEYLEVGCIWTNDTQLFSEATTSPKQTLKHIAKKVIRHIKKQACNSASLYRYL